MVSRSEALPVYILLGRSDICFGDSKGDGGVTSLSLRAYRWLSKESEQFKEIFRDVFDFEGFHWILTYFLK